MKPQPDDVLVSNRAATLDHDLSIVPHAPHVECPSRTAALARGRELAEARQVDLWVTDDHTHFVLVAAYRRPRT